MNSLEEKGFFSGEKGPIIWQSCFTLVLLQVAFHVKAQLCRSQLLATIWAIYAHTRILLIFTMTL